MKDDTYNGWSNYETWCYQLWLDNDQGLSEYWLMTANDVNSNLEGWNGTDDSYAIYTLSKMLKSDCNDSLDNSQFPGVFSDLLTASIELINWREIAESWLERANDN